MVNKRNAIVTGSTSGIGLGIATSLANTGVNVMLNGLGDPGEIETARARWASRRPERKGALDRVAAAGRRRLRAASELRRTRGYRALAGFL
jgi:NAD(P)-dependent dehydrogenase (short-subunit alcohol dehydrogenase family)